MWGILAFNRLPAEVMTAAISAAVVSALGVWLVMMYMDPYGPARQQVKSRAASLGKRLNRRVELNQYEEQVAAQAIAPEDIRVVMQDVAGLEHITSDLELKVMAPLRHPHLYSTTLLKQARGVLLYGPPGTGKTMLAQALAREAGCFFLNLTASSVVSKWMGDSNRLVRAAFSLAAKLEPAIIFVDEVDALLGRRGGASEHEVTLLLKTEFMQLWDGVETNPAQRVFVVGATNRPWMLDEAVLRRFAIAYEVGY
ncbi:hypothetical protein GPECTOR_250g622 [Gonium pectorale]|uniref:AAA+ ATPase domain-containing protein n=1 Tax=Gonium pectorale TaxID=33097 RepID=A0A150FW97_GONPE|nr:hypothetical protein GPECTOR_250g622 [Gonium pectorale]|eukprot:KXZ41894.1 hypothetical protein GPECTOR_250g622 [Gonium pectorale]